MRKAKIHMLFVFNQKKKQRAHQIENYITEKAFYLCAYGPIKWINLKIKIIMIDKHQQQFNCRHYKCVYNYFILLLNVLSTQLYGHLVLYWFDIDV